MTSPNDCLDCLDMVSPYRDARENAEKREMKCDCWTTCTDYDGHGEIFSIDFCPLHAAAPQLLEACEADIEMLKDCWDAINSLPDDALGCVDPKYPDEQGYYIKDALLHYIGERIAESQTAIRAARGE